MTLHEQVQDQFKQAMKAGDVMRRTVLGMLKAAFHNKAIEKGKKDEPLADDEAQDVLLSEIKKRKDSTAQFRSAGREELAAKEEEEVAVLMGFLPPQLSEGELRVLAKEAVAQAGAVSVKETGKVLAILAKQVKGRADMSLVVQIVKEHLSE